MLASTTTLTTSPPFPSSRPPINMHEKRPQLQQHNGAGLRIGIVHARWNAGIIDPLLEGTRAKLLASGVAAADIVVETVPGAWELPVAVQR